MTRFVCNDNLATLGMARIALRITGSHGNYRGTYSDNFLVLGPGNTPVEIELQNETTDGSLAAITDYSSTGVTARRSPIRAFKPSRDGTSAVLTISLLAHQLIDFGVFVELVYGDYPPTIIFCDPQASNDPIKNR